MLAWGASAAILGAAGSGVVGKVAHHCTPLSPSPARDHGRAASDFSGTRTCQHTHLFWTNFHNPLNPIYMKVAAWGALPPASVFPTLPPHRPHSQCSYTFC